MIKQGASDMDIADRNFKLFSQTIRAIDRLRFHVRPVLLGPRTIILNYGATGTGKTRFAYDSYPNLFELPVGKDIWFDGYHGQAHVLIDEFDGHIGLSPALKIFDNYYVRHVPIKGGFVWWNPQVIIVTSQSHPSTWYSGFSKGATPKEGNSDRYEQERALRRRFTEIRSFNRDGTVDSYTTPEAIQGMWRVPGDSQTINDLQVMVSLPSIESPSVYQEDDIPDVDLTNFMEDS